MSGAATFGSGVLLFVGNLAATLRRSESSGSSMLARAALLFMAGVATVGIPMVGLARQRPLEG